MTSKESVTNAFSSSTAKKGIHYREAAQEAETKDSDTVHAQAYRVGNCKSAGDTYCRNNCVKCDKSGRLVKKEGFDRHQGCPACWENCSCLK